MLKSRSQLSGSRRIQWRVQFGCFIHAYTGEQGWHSGENARLPPMWHEFDSSLAPYVD